jgi:hypothetical protein
METKKAKRARKAKNLGFFAFLALFVSLLHSDERNRLGTWVPTSDAKMIMRRSHSLMWKASAHHPLSGD